MQLGEDPEESGSQDLVVLQEIQGEPVVEDDFFDYEALWDTIEQEIETGVIPTQDPTVVNEA
jgi:hypothetical protein